MPAARARGERGHYGSVTPLPVLGAFVGALGATNAQGDVEMRVEVRIRGGLPGWRGVMKLGLKGGVDLFILEDGAYTTLASAVSLLVVLALLFSAVTATWSMSRAGDVQVCGRCGGSCWLQRGVVLSHGRNGGGRGHLEHGACGALRGRDKALWACSSRSKCAGAETVQAAFV